MAVSDDFRKQWLEMEEQYGKNIELGDIQKMEVGQVDETVSMPAVKFTDQTLTVFQEYRHVPMNTFMKPITDKVAEAETRVTKLESDVSTAVTQANAARDNANNAAGRVDTSIANANAAAATANAAAQNADSSRQAIEANESTRQTNESTRQSQESTRQSQEATRQAQESTRQSQESTRQSQESARETRATSDHNRAETDHTTATTDHSTATSDHSRAETDHTASVSATSEASNVNAQLEGMTVTITNRSGVQTSVNIGFEIYRTYTSVAAMQADAANVPQAKFVIIATTDATDPDNAKLYAKNAAGGFTFLSDLDQASSAAFADWLENYKPVIEADHTQAGLDHQQAVSDHSTAASDHTQAGTDHARAESDHTTSQTASGYANEQGDYAKNMADHPAYLADGTAAHPGDAGYLYTWDYARQQYVKGARISLDFDSMTPEQKEELADAVLAAIGFDTVPTENSDKAVTSGGLYIAFQNVNTALAGKQDTLTFATDATCEAIIDELV